WERESGATFDKFTYKDEELNEIEEYYIVESSDEELEIYKNPWRSETSPAIYMTLVEELPILEVEKLTPTTEEQLRGIVESKKLSNKERQKSETEEKKEEKDALLATSTEEKEWILSLAGLFKEEHRDPARENEEKDKYNKEKSESEEETTEEYYDWMEALNQKFKRVVTWSQHDAEEEGPEEPIPEAVLKRLTEYRSRAPSREMLMSSLHEARKEMNKTLDMEEFEKELEKKKPALEFLLETETADLEERKVSDPTKMKQSDYADPESTEDGTPKEEKE
ncbi:2746_t:CDS:2, partial [Gigaspora rosea]